MSYEAKLYIIGENATYLSSINYAIFQINNGKEWVAAYRPSLFWDPKNHFECFTEWAQGHYFNSYEECSKYIKNKMNDYIMGLSEEINDACQTLSRMKEGEFFND